MGFAAVAVDVAAGGVDRIFHYRLPPGLASRAAVGQRVRVPLGSRSVLGWIVGLPERPGVPEEQVRDVAELVDPEPALDRGQLDLAAWVAERYLSLYVQALRACLPGDLRAGRVRERTEWRLYPGEARPGTPARGAALEVLRAAPGLTRRELARRAGCGAGLVAALVREGAAVARAVPVRRDPFAAMRLAGGELRPAELTPHQEAALAAIVPAVEEPRPAAFLLFGVTGSGKTEVYLRAAERALAAGRQALVLVPEISLTPQAVARFRGRFGERLAVLHSGLGAGERHDEWWRARRGEVDVVVGARSAVYAPLPRLGLVVVDEEQEPSYKAEDAPRYHARAVALRRAELAGVPVVLGSATPSLESFAAAEEGRLTRLDLPRRVGGRPLPAVEAVDLRDELAAGNRSLLSERLAAALADCLSARGQALLFLNRRGFYTSFVCRECGFALRCSHCSVALAYHEADRLMHCHYCASRSRPPSVCPACGSRLIRQMGAGTQRVEAAVRERFPEARVLRMDADTTGSKGAHARIYDAFRRGEADVLVGTQMVAKGWDLAGVTLVGAVNADLSLHLPDFRAAERTFQLLCQVAGRAGRGDRQGEVVVQTYSPEHYAVQFAVAQDHPGFAVQELSVRRDLAYPPFGHLVRFVATAATQADAAAAARGVADALRPGLPAGFELLGPGEAPVARLRDQHRWHLALKGPDADGLRDLARDALRAVPPGRARLTVDVDPQSFM